MKLTDREIELIKFAFKQGWKQGITGCQDMLHGVVKSPFSGEDALNELLETLLLVDNIINL